MIVPGRILLRFLTGLSILSVAAAAREPILVPEISQHEVVVRQGFTGADLLLYGAILEPDGTRVGTGRAYDIVVVLKGPLEAITLREKRKKLGMWVNAESTSFRSAPAFYALASSRPVSQIVDAKTAAIYELGLEWLQLSPIGAIDPQQQDQFATGLVEKRVASGLYRQDESAVTISEGVLYQARIALPSSVTTGNYTAETFAIDDGRVVASATSEVEVVKRGFERAVELFSIQQAFWYGLAAVALSVFMGWSAGRLFASR
ncbi:TIGR02186 family protein [Croceicoccus sp. F390]|uniref:TIGR02186 family protein n=1 Tax=Croceicoccus esteveae TaxID=3075597 RepID=A0ABU2ZGB3_9SPHN|nr:TIGR02186 family protein [Croceicoccus sp. F390]MDT0574634.1 TIGR02186 family protein [Croceicoccus sp. F390]